MEVKTLYRTIRADGGVDVSPNKPTEGEYTETYRLIADDGMELVKGDVRTICIDTDTVDGWEEVESIEPIKEAIE